MAQKIGVYLSSKDNLPASYVEAARQVGHLIGSTGRTLVYGGARKGLMEVLAQSVKASGGRVYGMVPEIIEQNGLGIGNFSMQILYYVTDAGRGSYEYNGIRN